MPTKPKLAAEYEQKDQNDDDQKHHGKHTAAATSAVAGLDDGRAIGIAIVVGHGKLSLLRSCVGETNESMRKRFRQGGKSMKFHYMLGAALIAVASCGPQRQPADAVDNNSSSAASAPAAPAIANQDASGRDIAPAAPPTPVRVPPPPPPPPPVTPAPPPPADSISATDPKGVGAALDLARQFAGLVSARKFDQAYALLGGRGGFASAAEFKRHFAPYSNLDLAVLDSPPPEAEGAAGSIYLSVQAQLSGMVDGRRVNRPAKITLRRVNDVPGSTEAQRRWHIEGFDDAAM
jgi:hypothetical protein